MDEQVIEEKHKLEISVVIFLDSIYKHLHFTPPPRILLIFSVF